MYRDSNLIDCRTKTRPDSTEWSKGAPQTDVGVRGATRYLVCLPIHLSPPPPPQMFLPPFFFPPISDHFPFPSFPLCPILSLVVRPTFRPSDCRTVHKSDGRLRRRRRRRQQQSPPRRSPFALPPSPVARWGHTLNVRAMSEVEQNALARLPHARQKTNTRQPTEEGPQSTVHACYIGLGSRYFSEGCKNLVQFPHSKSDKHTKNRSNTKVQRYFKAFHPRLCPNARFPLPVGAKRRYFADFPALFLTEHPRCHFNCRQSGTVGLQRRVRLATQPAGRFWDGP